MQSIKNKYMEFKQKNRRGKFMKLGVRSSKWKEAEEDQSYVWVALEQNKKIIVLNLSNKNVSSTWIYSHTLVITHKYYKNYYCNTHRNERVRFIYLYVNCSWEISNYFLKNTISGNDPHRRFQYKEKFQIFHG